MVSRRKFFALVGAAVLINPQPQPSFKRQRLDKAIRIAQAWAKKHTILRPWTGQVFISPCNGLDGDENCPDYIEVGSLQQEEDKKHG